MKTNTHLRRSFVSSDDQTVIVCPNCKFVKPLSVSQFRDRKHILQIKCKCGHTFKVQLEFRRYIRKKVDLEGECDLDSTKGEKWKVTLVDISFGGVCLELDIPHNFKVGEEGTVRFVLNDQKQTALNSTIIIKSVTSKQIRCQFTGENTFQKDLGFYLQS
jgi:c-di-GMP-binding flagellar brake protein YcgR